MILLRRSPELVFELHYDPLHLSFGTASRKPVFAFEQHDEIVAPAGDTVEILGIEFRPAMVDFISEMFPLEPENVAHRCCLFLADSLLRHHPFDCIHEQPDR